jgi:hypothetical protein
VTQAILRLCASLCTATFLFTVAGCDRGLDSEGPKRPEFNLDDTCGRLRAALEGVPETLRTAPDGFAPRFGPVRGATGREHTLSRRGGSEHGLSKDEFRFEGRWSFGLGKDLRDQTGLMIRPDRTFEYWERDPKDGVVSRGSWEVRGSRLRLWHTEICGVTLGARAKSTHSLGELSDPLTAD